LPEAASLKGSLASLAGEPAGDEVRVLERGDRPEAAVDLALEGERLGKEGVAGVLLAERMVGMGVKEEGG